ncbi:MAG: methionyl-tRNA formyltransferase [Microbacteriaceae bacterium]|nr:methionyl-tRNA formyltransferase [Microbacteriaceae bacterium]
MIDYVFAGSDSTASSVLEALAKHSKPKLVITREDAPFGRKRELRQTVVADIADSLGVKTVKANDPALVIADIKSSGAKRGIVVSYGAILKGEVLETLQWFNLHFSLLPKLRGAAPVQRAILNDERPTGVSIFQIDAGMDSGPIYDQFEVDIVGLNTAQALKKMAENSLGSLSRLLSETSPILQKQSGDVTKAPKLTREECELDLNHTSEALLRVVLAAYPEPVAWVMNNGHPLRILSARTSGLSFPEEDQPIGQVEKLAGKVYVSCGNHTRLELLQVQPFSKKPMPAIDWFNGVGEATLGN